MDLKYDVHLCRTCLTPCQNENYPITSDIRKLYSKIGCRILSTDFLKQICYLCHNLFENLMKFHRTAINTELKLKDLLKRHPNKKPDTEITFVNIVESEEESKPVITELCHNRPLSRLSVSSHSNHAGDLSDFDEFECKTEVAVKCELNLIEGEDEVLRDKEQDGKNLGNKPRGRPKKPGSLENVPKRPRGRPSKPRDNENDPKRPRGRPPKPKENLNETCPQKRGRPFNPNKVKKTYKRVHICDLCGRKFSNKMKIDFHQAREHYVELKMPVVECDQCKAKFGSKKAFQIHFQNHHKERICPECGKVYTTYKGYYLHRFAVHKNTEKIHSCEICGKTFNTTKYLSAHRSTHNPSYPCPLCPNQLLATSVSLRSHIKSNHKELELPPPGTALKNYDWSKSGVLK